jgi:hypothetical protein
VLGEPVVAATATGTVVVPAARIELRYMCSEGGGGHAAVQIPGPGNA